MLLILSPSNSPEFNLAAEEYLFRNFSDDLLFLYVNAPAVVVGKHQNAMAETNSRFLHEHNIKLIRRLSGGGAVYHDQGNLNFSFHKTVEDTAKIAFKAFNDPIVEVLQQMGIPAEVSPRNDIFVNGFKVSGHAEHVFRKRILSHGTLLFNANRENLSKALKNNAGTFHGKAIQSVRSKVANIVDFLEKPMELGGFIQRIVSHFTRDDSNTVYILNEKDQEQIQVLANEKYDTWEWNYGYSPKYQFEKELTLNNEIIRLKTRVEKGIIQEITIDGNIADDQKKAVQELLLNSPHSFGIITQLTAKLDSDLQYLILEGLF